MTQHVGKKFACNAGDTGDSGSISGLAGSKKSIGGLWKHGVAGFYVLAALEVFYMTTPFALYMYSVYGPLLEKLYAYPATSWLASFYLPHLVETSSSIITFCTEILSTIAVSVGVTLFLISAVHLYYFKLIRKTMVSGGLYRFIRHPQYLGLGLIGFGIILMWPRFFSLVMFVTMLFAYYLLAKSEERICENKFGERYLEYMDKTPRFFLSRFFDRISMLFPFSGLKKGLFVFGFYLVSLTVVVGLGILLKAYSKSKVSYFTEDDTMVVSVKPMEVDQIRDITRTFMSRNDLKEVMSLARDSDNSTFLIYITPERWKHYELTSTFKIKGEEESPDDEGSDQESNENIRKLILLKVEPIGKGYLPISKLLDVEVRVLPLALAYYDIRDDEITSISELEVKDVGFNGAPMPII